ncbi:MAG TPA: peptidase E [Candidatus Saccharimonadales bacterium]|nr:peptidase E [Candidatus Saccharimonadales bacterium]
MKIVAIGGGEIGRPGYPVETTEIDKEIIKLTGKNNPTLLFLPTASSDSEGYVSVVHEHFQKRLGCKVDVLYLLNKKVSRQEMEEKIFSSDIVYVGGGNTLKMMNIWRRTGVDELLQEAGNKGIILSGVSAGAICWFRYGSSDSRRFTNPKADLIRVSGLGLIPILLCPHYDVEVGRKSDLKDLMKKTSGVAIAIDNCCAIEIVNDQYRIIDSKLTANAYKVYWKDGKYVEVKIEKNKDFTPISSLLLKP